MQLNPYLRFKGNCEEALTFYAQCFGGTLGELFRYRGTPLATQVPAEWADKVMHGSVTVGGQTMMAGDVAPDDYEEPKGFSMSLHIKGTADAKRVFHELATNGQLLVPFEKTFWSEGFGMVVDRFGIPWLINAE